MVLIVSFNFCRKKLLLSCWEKNPKIRPDFSNVIQLLSEYSELISPCLDAPSASVQTCNTATLPHQNIRKVTVQTSRVPPQPRLRHRSGVEYQTELDVCFPSSSSGPLINSGSPSSTLISNSSTLNTTTRLNHVSCNRQHLENGNGPSYDPLLSLTDDAYIARYVLLQRNRSTESSGPENSSPNITSV